LECRQGFLAAAHRWRPASLNRRIFRLSGREKGKRLARRMSQVGVTPRRLAASSGVRSLSDVGGGAVGSGLASRAFPGPLRASSIGVALTVRDRSGDMAQCWRS
jgi:hypothetical protein